MSVVSFVSKQTNRTFCLKPIKPQTYTIKKSSTSTSLTSQSQHKEKKSFPMSHKHPKTTRVHETNQFKRTQNAKKTNSKSKSAMVFSKDIIEAHVHNKHARIIDSFYILNRSEANIKLLQFYICTFIEECINKTLTKYLHTSTKNWNIFQFGSKVWGIDSINSDIDMAIDLKQKKMPRCKKQNILKRIMVQMGNATSLLMIKDVTSARYPIIKICDKHFGIKIDLSVSDEYCLKTTKCISSIFNFYAKSGIPIRKFIVFIKHWSKKCAINNSMKGYLNSFGYTLMAINFIQFMQNDIMQSKVMRNVSCLVAGFFAFYGFIFDHLHHRIDINDKRNALSYKQRRCVLEIVDPVNERNNVSNKIDILRWMEIKVAMMRAYKMYSNEDYVQKVAVDIVGKSGYCRYKLEGKIYTFVLDPIKPMLEWLDSVWNDMVQTKIEQKHGLDVIMNLVKEIEDALLVYRGVRYDLILSRLKNEKNSKRKFVDLQIYVPFL